MMMLTCAGLMLFLAGAAGETPAATVQADGSPVRLDRATILTAADGPPVLLYSATNLTDNALDQFTVIAFVFASKSASLAFQIT